MVPSVALLSLLGAAALAGVQLAPVEKEDHAEEIVTRCIVEVLLNGLSKANAPPINPQCKELLRKTRFDRISRPHKPLSLAFAEDEKLHKYVFKSEQHQQPGRWIKKKRDSHFSSSPSVQGPSL